MMLSVTCSRQLHFLILSLLCPLGDSVTLKNNVCMYCVFVCNDAEIKLICTRPVFGDYCQNNYFCTVENVFRFVALR